MSVWLTIPSARPTVEADRVLMQWRERGYKIALWRDAPPIPTAADYVEVDKYPGYAAAVNFLIRRVMVTDPAAEWFVAAGDDTLPDPSKTAEEIARQCSFHFSEVAAAYRERAEGGVRGGLAGREWSSTFGVMQPTGDRWHEGVGGFHNAPIDRVAGSAWYGREYCRRMYQGDGPLFRGYQHMFVDEEAQAVAEKMGVFWQRRDLTQKHLHWGRGATDKAVIELKPGTIPPHLEKWNTSQHWNEAKALFQSRKAAGFPGHEPIP